MTTRPYYFKVKYGFDSTDYVIITAGPDLERAIYAKIERIPVTLAGKFIEGKHIIVIEPDYHSYTGWYRTYLPSSGEDFAQIERDMPKEIGSVLDTHYQVVEQLASGGQEEAIGQGFALKQAEERLLLE